MSRRRFVIEGSFADAANNHGYKRARWRRIWRVTIQNFLIAALQNLRKLLSFITKKPRQANSISFFHVYSLIINEYFFFWLFLKVFCESVNRNIQTMFPKYKLW